MSKNKGRRSFSLSGVLFILGGIAILLNGMFTHKEYLDIEEQRKQYVKEISAQITSVYHQERYSDINDSKSVEHIYTVHFTYELDGKEYGDSFVSTTKYEQGDTFRIFCDPDEPSQWISAAEIDYQSYRESDVKESKPLGVGLIVLGVLWSITVNVIIRKRREDHE